MKKAMKKRTTVVLGVMATAVLLVAALGGLSSAQTSASATLDGYNEVPAVSTTGGGQFTLQIVGDTMRYRLEYSGLEGNVLAAHIHLGQEDVNGGIIAFLCGGGGKPDCPQSGVVRGQIVASDIIGPEGQGIAPGEFDEAVAAIEAGVTYANVHSDKHPGGEIRGQIQV